MQKKVCAIVKELNFVFERRLVETTRVSLVYRYICLNTFSLRIVNGSLSVFMTENIYRQMGRIN